MSDIVTADKVIKSMKIYLKKVKIGRLNQSISYLRRVIF